MRRLLLTAVLSVALLAPAACVYTVTDVEVVRTYKGSAGPGAKVAVKQMGGRLDGVDHVVERMAYLRAGTSYLLFLAEFQDSPGIPASPLNPDQGQYPLDGAGQPQPVPGNPITFTVEDLQRLSPATLSNR